MVYEYLIELFSYSYVGAHLSRFQQLLVTVSLHSYDVQKKKKVSLVLNFAGNQGTTALFNQDVIDRITEPAWDVKALYCNHPTRIIARPES